MWHLDAGDSASEAAFDATLALVRARPRDIRRPYFYGCGLLVSARLGDMDPPTWYALTKVTAALADIVLDREADADFRAEAARAIATSGDEPTLAAVRRALAKPKTKADKLVAEILAPQDE
jgi:hypothetical protein